MKNEIKSERAARDLFFMFIEEDVEEMQAIVLYKKIKDRLEKLVEDVTTGDGREANNSFFEKVE